MPRYVVNNYMAAHFALQNVISKSISLSPCMGTLVALAENLRNILPAWSPHDLPSLFDTIQDRGLLEFLSMLFDITADSSSDIVDERRKLVFGIFRNLAQTLYTHAASRAVLMNRNTVGRFFTATLVGGSTAGTLKTLGALLSFSATVSIPLSAMASTLRFLSVTLQNDILPVLLTVKDRSDLEVMKGEWAWAFTGFLTACDAVAKFYNWPPPLPPFSAGADIIAPLQSVLSDFPSTTAKHHIQMRKFALKALSRILACTSDIDSNSSLCNNDGNDGRSDSHHMSDTHLRNAAAQALVLSPELSNLTMLIHAESDFDQVHLFRLLARCFAVLNDDEVLRVFTENDFKYLSGQIMNIEAVCDALRMPLLKVTARLLEARHAGTITLLRKAPLKWMSPLFNLLFLYRANSLDPVFHGAASSFAYLFDALLASAAPVDLVSTALRLNEAGAVRFCTRTLMTAALWGDGRGDKYNYTTGIIAHPNVAGALGAGGGGSDGESRINECPALGGLAVSGTTVARLLRVLRGIIVAYDNLPGAEPISRLADGTPQPNSSVADFSMYRGLQTLELLRFADCMREDGPALSELKLLRALLERMSVLQPPTKVETDDDIAGFMQAAIDARTFARSFDGKGGWPAAFDLHIACTLEESGYPRRLKTSPKSTNFEPVAAPVRGDSGAPSAAALALLQMKARELLRMVNDLIFRVAVKPLENVAMIASFGLPSTQGVPQKETFRLVIELNDCTLPTHAAHFRAAAKIGALGQRLHRCFTLCPSSLSPPATLPYVTLYNNLSNCYCVTSPISLPSTDIVYGEYTAPATAADGSDAATYAAGTVLYYPRSMVAPVDSPVTKSSDTPWFIVIKPCDNARLRGAVPVGRVVVCSAGVDKVDVGEQLFDAESNLFFQRLCGGDTNVGINGCGVNAYLQTEEAYNLTCRKLPSKDPPSKTSYSGFQLSKR